MTCTVQKRWHSASSCTKAGCRSRRPPTISSPISRRTIATAPKVSPAGRPGTRGTDRRLEARRAQVLPEQLQAGIRRERDVGGFQLKIPIDSRAQIGSAYVDPMCHLMRWHRRLVARITTTAIALIPHAIPSRGLALTPPRPVRPAVRSEFTGGCVERRDRRRGVIHEYAVAA